MVNQVLQRYIRAVEKRMRHLPPKVRNRLVAEVTGHVILEVAAIRRKDPSIDQEDAAQQVIDSFCPPEEMLVAYGHDGGVVRSSTGQLILRSRVLTDLAPGDRTYFLTGAAAAGWALFVGLLAIVAFAIVPGLAPLDPLDVQDAEPEVLLDTGFQGLTGNQSLFVTVDRPGQFEVVVEVSTDSGCVEVDLVPPNETVVHGPGCEPQVSIVSGNTGSWRIDLRAQDFDGRVTVTVWPM